jgi:hypothetical protein
MSAIEKRGQYLTSYQGRQKLLKWGAVLVAAHFVWGLSVLFFLGESHQYYLLLMAPAGLVGNFVMPAWLALVAYQIHTAVRKSPDERGDVH